MKFILGIVLSLSMFTSFSFAEELSIKESIMIATSIESTSTTQAIHIGGQDAEPVPDESSNMSFIGIAFQKIGGMAGAKTLTIILLISQLLLAFTNTTWFHGIKGIGSYRVTIVSVLTVIAAVLALMGPPENLSFLAALTSSSVLTLIGSGLHKVLIENKTA